jgi:hypothetical protein
MMTSEFVMVAIACHNVDPPRFPVRMIGGLAAPEVSNHANNVIVLQ